MEKLHEDFTNITKYLIELFYQTEKKYSCPRTKIGKLLSILAFSYARKGIKLFDETIYKYPGCGTAIADIMVWVDRDVYFSFFPYNDDKKPINYIPLYTHCDIPQEYKCSNYPSKEICLKIQEIFQKFGSYSTSDLGHCLNPIVELEGVTKPDKSINLEKIRELHLSDFKETNEVIEYIFSERNEKNECI